MPEDNAGRIVHVLFLVVSQSAGGAELQTVSLANGLDKSIFRVTLVYLKDEPDGTDILHALTDAVKAFCGGVMNRIDITALRKLRGFIKRESVDIVVCTNTFPLLYGWLALRCLKPPALLNAVFHTTEPGTLKTKLQMVFYRHLFKATDNLIFVCETQRAYWSMKNLPAPRSSVIHNGIDVERFNNCFSGQEVSSTRKSLGFEDSDFIVGICASLRPEKAHSDLLDALAYLKKRGYRFKCMIIGDGPEREKITRAVELRDLGSDVALTGFIADVRIYIAACDVMALVSHYVETFSLSALEAMSMGKPMIMSDVGGASEQVIPGYNGALFPAGDIHALARCILETKYANADGAMGTNARDSVVKRFSRERMVSMFEREFLTMVRYSQDKGINNGWRKVGPQ